jgi:hypothetical protein
MTEEEEDRETTKMTTTMVEEEEEDGRIGRGRTSPRTSSHSWTE